MSKESTTLVFFAIVCTAIGSFAGVQVERYKQTENYKATAIEYGCAAYDRKTGQWAWEKPLLTRDDMEAQALDTASRAIPSSPEQSKGIEITDQKAKTKLKKH